MSTDQDIADRLEQVVDLLHDEGFSLRDSPCTDVVRARLEILRLRAELVVAKAEPIRPMLAWITAPPTEPGDYWARGPRLMGKQELVHLYRVDSGEMRMDEGRIVPDDLEWWGPVSRPPKSP